jgi:hypothetical protein
MTFDPMNRKSSLHTHHHRSNSASTPAPPQVISGDLGYISQIISSVASLAHAPSKPPSTPTRRRGSSSASSKHSPNKNTPSQLKRFLEYAEAHLGVEGACSYEQSLRMQGFGPDILHLVDDGALKDIGFTPGDVIRLKQNSQRWWNSTDAKRKRESLRDDNTVPSEPLVQRRRPNDIAPSPLELTPPSQKVTYEKHYNDGGRYRFYGPRMKEGEFTPADGAEWFYFCRARDTMVSLPPNYIPILEGDVEAT